MPRLSFDRWPALLYAIGDVHGCLPQLLDLERQIVADATGVEGEKWIVMLGDYVDRGPQSAGVIDHLLMPPPAGFRRFCLRGNHEQMMLDFLDDPDQHAYWLLEGGIETLQSYDVGPGPIAPRNAHHVGRHIPLDHLQFLRGLPFLLSLPGTAFVHAGIRPGVSLAEQADEDLIWIREPFLSSDLADAPRVVHGHTPGPEPVVTAHRVCLDTRCYLTGRLTAARIAESGGIKFFTANGREAGAS